MGPVAFETIASELDRQQALVLAARLTKAGIRPTISSDGTSILVRSDQAAASRALLVED